ncbi:MAG: PQQ-dependent sugar dehydrogenase [Rhizobacter sp.]|nr:PQQ-dependent sugar dehydrogenase [Rhizobacter sp.]
MTPLPVRAIRALASLCVSLALVACGGGGGDDVSSNDDQRESTQAVTWTRVAGEGQTFTLVGSRIVRYGEGTRWLQRTLSGTVACTNATFGSDPAYGVAKSCQVQSTTPDPEPPPATQWTRIATEWQSFTVTGTRVVRYGAGTRWLQRSVTGTGSCTNSFFGGDPAYGVAKACEVQTSSNQVPVATISGPIAGATFRAGDTITFSGSGTDVEDGALPASRLTWWAELHHDVHSHPFQPQTVGATGTVTIPTQGETASNIFYRFHLRATDSAGATHEVTRDIQPQTAQVTVTTAPLGLSLTLDGQPITGPTAFTGVVGIERALMAPATQNLNGRRYQFASWSDGGAATHTISTPVANTTYTANYTDIGPVTNAPPTVAITTPANNSAATSGVAVALAATAGDSDGSVASVAFFENGVQIGATDTSSPYGVSWTPSATGTRSLTARATDNLGAVTLSGAVSVTVNTSGGDTQAPVATLTSPANLASGLAGTLTLSAGATDNIGVTGVDFQVDGVQIGSTDTSAPYSVTADSNLYASGQHVIRARARDAAGNLSAWAAATVQFGGSRNQPAGITLTDQWVSGFSAATAFAQAPDGRMFVTQQGGQLRVVSAGALLSAPFITLTVDSVGERGLLGVALHPNFASNRFVYLYYTTPEGGTHNRISRFTANASNPNVVSAGSELRIADLPTLSSATNHNGGALHFGNDGKLYVAVGDNANSANAPDLNIPFGKMLRFNDDGSIPSDNPFCTTTGTLRCAIWARGLRNPFTFAVRRSDGRMHINDVGAGSWEEINLGVPGANYGWPATEGPTNAAGVTAPLFAYDHTAAATGPAGFFNGCAITGGAFYPADSGPFPVAYRGSYFFTDFCTPFIGRVDMANGNTAYTFGRVAGQAVGMLTGLDGALYVLAQSRITRFSAP